MNPPEHQFLTVQEFADIIRVHPSTVQRMAAIGQLPGAIIIRTGKRKKWRIPANAIEALVATPVPSDLQPLPKTDLVADPYSLLKKWCKSVR